MGAQMKILESLCEGLLLLGLMTGTCTESTLAIVTQVVDGDTIVVRYENDNSGDKIRLLGIDAPEIRGHCPSEKQQAVAARRRLKSLLPLGSVVTLNSDSIRWRRDRYGRLLAKVSAGGRDVGKQLVREGLARRWKPPSPRINWCKGRH